MRRLLIFISMILTASPIGAQEDKAANNRGGVLGALDVLAKETQGPPESWAHKDAADSAGDEKFSDFVKRARADIETPEEVKEKEPSKALKAAHLGTKGVEWGAKLGGKKAISKAAGGTADVLKGVRAIDETRKGKRTGATKAAELAVKYGAGTVPGMVAKPVGAAIETTAQGMDKVNVAMDNPTEENLAEVTRHVEEFKYEAAKNAGVDIKKIKKKTGTVKDWFFDKLYQFAPGWMPDNEKNKRDLIKQRQVDLSAFE